jgi:hypothetical protein
LREGGHLGEGTEESKVEATDARDQPSPVS